MLTHKPAVGDRGYPCRSSDGRSRHAGEARTVPSIDQQRCLELTTAVVSTTTAHQSGSTIRSLAQYCVHAVDWRRSSSCWIAHDGVHGGSNGRCRGAHMLDSRSRAPGERIVGRSCVSHDPRWPCRASRERGRPLFGDHAPGFRSIALRLYLCGPVLWSIHGRVSRRRGAPYRRSDSASRNACHPTLHLHPIGAGARQAPFARPTRISHQLTVKRVPPGGGRATGCTPVPPARHALRCETKCASRLLTRFSRAA